MIYAVLKIEIEIELNKEKAFNARAAMGNGTKLLFVPGTQPL